MKKRAYDYVDVFYGCADVDHFPEDGLASKWFYVKAQCGNTLPHAWFPFGRMTAGAYSGGYSGGYGINCPNSCGKVPKMDDVMRIRGISHIHQSGPGYIEYFYNYAIVSPFYGSIDQIMNYHEALNEVGRPGYYAVEFNDIACEVTVNHNTAVHHYSYKKNGGRLAVDFSNDGLCRAFGGKAFDYVRDVSVRIVSPNEVAFEGNMHGVRLYFWVKLEGSNVKSRLFNGNCEVDDQQIHIEESPEPYGAVFDFDDNEVIVKVSYSTLGYKAAQVNVYNAASFDAIAQETGEIWQLYLTAVEIETEDEELKEKFYSNLYHSITHPKELTGEKMLGIEEDVMDFGSLWDAYKTLYPLIFALYPHIGNKLVKALVATSRAWGKLPCSIGIADTLPCEMQAKMLGIYALCDAYYYGIEAATTESIAECIERELAREDYKIFLEKGIFERYTHILDTTEACRAVADIIEDGPLKERLLALAANWVNAFDEDGIMSVKSPYYEGDRYTYSFRLQNNMEERIALAGGRERFLELLDNFFGFNRVSLKAPNEESEPHELIHRILSTYHRFEGFNNECDMEAPYAYIYAGRQDRTCDIIHEGITRSFGLGRGGLPGNNDLGGLSSCLVWNVLGVFPATGTGEFLLGCPHVDRAVMHFGNGRKLEIIAKDFSNENHYVQSVEFNDEKVTDFRIPAHKLLCGGKLVFQCTNQSEGGANG